MILYISRFVLLIVIDSMVNLSHLGQSRLSSAMTFFTLSLIVFNKLSKVVHIVSGLLRSTQITTLRFFTHCFVIGTCGGYRIFSQTLVDVVYGLKISKVAK